MAFLQKPYYHRIMLNTYRIFIPELNRTVKFKALSSAVAREVALEANADNTTSYEEYINEILKAMVFNLYTDVLPRLVKLKSPAKEEALMGLYNGCVMLNPVLDTALWLRLAFLEEEEEESVQKLDPLAIGAAPEGSPENESTTLSLSKFRNLVGYLSDRVIGQPHAISTLYEALKRAQAGLNDPGKPLGVFIFAGSSGVGKTLLAKELHEYMFGSDYPIVRIDCGEYQQKHENQKLLGSPPGYRDHEKETFLSKAMMEYPRTVVLLDEVEKAHADLWHTFLRIFDEGILRDSRHNLLDFRQSIIIMTTNLGNREMTELVTGSSAGFGSRISDGLTTTELVNPEEADKAVKKGLKKHFNPELLGRTDKIIVFNQLSREDRLTIAELEMRKLEDRLSVKGYDFNWNDTVIDTMVEAASDTVKGARDLHDYRREHIDSTIAEHILEENWPHGTRIDLVFDAESGEYTVSTVLPPMEGVREEE